MADVTGWDIGGAHLKAAVLRDGRLMRAVQVPCPLWQGMDRLEHAFDAVLAEIGDTARHAITMTGELVDLFESRAEGVTRILKCVRAKLGANLSVYAGPVGFVGLDNAAGHIEKIAAANWHATASLCARQIGDGLLIDIGSTTTDVIPLRDGRVAARAYDDTSRLTVRELVYSAVIRTPVMAVAPEALYQRQRVPVMAEYFATMADVYRLTGELPFDVDQGSTADGRGKTTEESAARLARMIGRNLGDVPMQDWQAMARDLRASQMRALVDATMRVTANTSLPNDAPVIVAGAGAFLARAVAEAIGRKYVEFEGVLGGAAGSVPGASLCAPAVAVALLLEAGQARDFAAA